jgi:hypothetical protein
MLASIRTIQEDLVDWKLHTGRCARQILCNKWITKSKNSQPFLMTHILTTSLQLMQPSSLRKTNLPNTNGN